MTASRLARAAVAGAAVLALACAAARGTTSKPRGELWAFTGPWDSLSNASVVANARRLDAAVTGWIALDTVTYQPVLLYPDPLGNGERPRRMALVTSWYRDRFHPATIRALGADAARLAATAGATARLAKSRGYRGLVLDFEAHEPADLSVLVAVARAFADSARASGVGPVSMAIPATDTVGYPARPLLQSVDALVVMLYDQHWAGSEPGPIADRVWARTWLGVRVREAGADRLVAGLPTYGYSWRTGKQGETVGFGEARRAVQRAGTRLTRDETSGWLRGSAGGATVWVSDARVVARLAADARALGVTRVALWRLGLEDPALWKALSR
ncbi:MAG TPA: hypothetical protein VHM30_01540 [Gemmatimonadaceae bacterium]|nr:hypothetical protein [Gemmatimonadaceae bacterium]